MTDSVFERPILNSPYAYPGRHWELDADHQPTNRIEARRRRCDLITLVPMPQRRRRAPPGQTELGLGADDGLSTPEQQYDVPRIINEIRGYVDNWRRLPNPGQWQVTPATARLLPHWRHHRRNQPQPGSAMSERAQRIADRCRVWASYRSPASGIVR